MKLTKDQIAELLRTVGATEDEELNCSQCHRLIAEFADRQLAGETIPHGLSIVEQHLTVCTECHEEYELLKLALSDLEYK